MKRKKLEVCSRKVLADMARKKHIAGWHAMGKEELVVALGNGSSTKAPRAQPQRTVARKTLIPPANRGKHKLVLAKSLASASRHDLPAGFARDRIVLMVRDPYWLHCYWELSRRSIQRAEAALGQDWHSATPVLRMYDVRSRDISSSAEAVVKDIRIHGGCNNWYIDVSDPPQSYRVEIGYLSNRGQFYALARSNIVTTPRAGVSDRIDNNWSDLDVHKAERIYAMSAGFDPNTNNVQLKQLFEERLRRPLGPPAVTAFGTGAHPAGRSRRFFFKLDAELIVYGATEANAKVTIQGEPLKLRPDGTFTMRFRLPDSRQIIPATAASADGVEERTVVLAVERNTKELEPMIHDMNNE